MPEVFNSSQDATWETWGYRVDLTSGNSLPAPGAAICYLDYQPDYESDSGWIHGFARDNFGNPLPGAMVVVDAVDTPDHIRLDFGSGIADASGYYVIPNISSDSAFSVYGQVVDPVTQEPLMMGMVSDTPGEANQYWNITVGAVGNFLPDLVMNAAWADEINPAFTGIIDSGPNWVTLGVTEKLSPTVYNRSFYHLGETAPLAATDTTIAIAHIIYEPENNRVILETQWRMHYDNDVGDSFVLRIDSGITDWVGNPIADTEINFSYQEGVDNDSPQILSVIAVEGDSTGGQIAVFFSEAVDGGAEALTWQSLSGGLVIDAAERIQPNAIVFHCTPAMVDGQLYTFTADITTNPKDYALNSLEGDTQFTFYGMNRGLIEDVHLVVLAKEDGQPEVHYGSQILIANDYDSHALVRSLRDPVGIFVSLTACDPDKLPEIVEKTDGGYYAALVTVDSVTIGETTIAAFGAGQITVSSTAPVYGLTESAIMNVSDTYTGYRNGVITGSVSDTSLIVVNFPDYMGEVYVPDQFGSEKGYIGAGESFTVSIDLNAMAELTVTRLADLQTKTIYDIQVVPGETVSVGQITFAATTDTFGMITGVLDRPETGPALIYYTPSGERVGWVDIYVHASGSEIPVGKPINPDADFIQLANGDIKYTIWGVPVARSETTTYVVEMHAYGYQPMSQSVSLSYQKKDRTNVNFALKVAGNGIIRGQVTNMVELPIRDVELIASMGQYGEGTEVAAFTNDMGFYEFTHMPPGNYVIKAYPEESGYATNNVRINLDTGATAFANLRLMPGNAIRGQVWRTSDSAPVSGVKVEAVSLLAGMDGEILEAFTNSEGKFILLGIPQLNNLSYRLDIQRSGYSALFLNGIEPGDTTVSAPLSAVSAQTGITGRVSSSDTYLSGVKVIAWSQGSVNVSLTAQTNTAGTFTFSSVPAGYYELEMVKPGYRRNTIQNVAVIADAMTYLDEVFLEDGASISGRITTSNGAGIGNALVQAVSADGYFGSAKTNSNGYYSIVGLVKNASYRMSVIQNGGADIYPYSKLIFLTENTTINIQVSDYGPQFLVDCQRDEVDSTTFKLTITASENLSVSPVLSIDTGHGYFTAGGVSDSTAIKVRDRVYAIYYTEPDTYLTTVKLIISGTDLQNKSGTTSYTFYPLYENNQEVLLNSSRAGQYSLDNGAGVIVPQGAYANPNDTSTDPSQSSVRLRISQVDLQQSIGGAGAPAYYGAPAYLAHYGAPSASGGGADSRVSNDYDIHMTDGTGETIPVADGKYITITIPYDPAVVSDTDAMQKVHLYYFNESLGRWVGEVTSQTVNTTNHTITISVNHLSKFAAFKEPDLVGDIYGGGSVDNLDLMKFNVDYQSYQADPVTGYDASSDISGASGVADGAIDFEDAAKLGQQYGQ